MVVNMKTKDDHGSSSKRYDHSRMGKKGDECLRWRSTGWTPLAYPASALVDNPNGLIETNVAMTDNTVRINEYFPLNRNVLRAATREILILEGSLKSETLELVHTPVYNYSKSPELQVNEVGKINYLGPAYVQHLYPRMWCRGRNAGNNQYKGDDQFSKEKKSSKGRKLKRKFPATMVEEKKQKIGASDRDSSSKPNMASKTTENFIFNEFESPRIIDTPNISAESLTDRIVERAGCEREQVIILDMLMSQNRQRIDPRMIDKVPDVMDATNDAVGGAFGRFPSRHMANREQKWNTLSWKKLPAFLDVSIVLESSLRNLSYQMVSQMYQSFCDESLRLFLGYKSCSMKRDRVLRILSDYLFDVSHAFFAWKQTEVEFASQRSTATVAAVPSFHKEIDLIISDSLFDERALKKIAGVDDSSILRHAIEISRSEIRKETWEHFAKTATGRRMLSHHRTGSAQLVGRKRREQRVKRFPGFISCDSSSESGQPRSRASSIASNEDVNVNRIDSLDSQSNATTRRERTHTGKEKFSHLSQVLEISLSRDEGSSWGVLLAREGDMCVVDRASKGGSLLSGDLILSVKDESGKSVSPPSTSNLPTIRNADPCWFRDMVNVFKNSDHVVLVVRRVRSKEQEAYFSVVS